MEGINPQNLSVTREFDFLKEIYVKRRQKTEELTQTDLENSQLVANKELVVI